MLRLKAFLGGRRRRENSGDSAERRKRNKVNARAGRGGRAGSGDATVRDAVAFLAEEDAESALVYALVHDPEFRLATAVASVRASYQRVCGGVCVDADTYVFVYMYMCWDVWQGSGGVDVNVVRALLYVFENYEDQLRKFLGVLMFREMAATFNWSELFRANSATTAVSLTLY